MTHIIDMASGKPCLDIQPVSPKRRAQRSEPEWRTDFEHPQLQLATTQLTESQPDSPTLPAGLDITELLQSLED